MTTLICAGGSGTRVLEAVLHLCAAGLGPTKLRTFVIDPDESNGNVDKTRKLLDRYTECHNAFKSSDQPFFQTELDLLNSPQGLRVWRPVDPQQKFKAVLNYTDLSRENKDVVHLLLTKEELEMEMNVGFRGHPALGAAALSLLPLYRDDPLWSQFVQAIAQDVAQRETRLVIAGSVFGGTGASTIHPLVRYLRRIPQQNADKLKVAAVALVPYFRFSAAESAAETGLPETETAAQSEWFPLASRSAAEYYYHLQRNDDWPFDAMYWLGDDSPMKVEYSKGGPKQKNPAHFIDLLAAFACFEFFNSPSSRGDCHYAGPLEAEDVPGENVLAWDDIPMSESRDVRRKRLHQFHMIAAAHLGFYGPLLEDARLKRSPHCVSWYLDRFSNGQEAMWSKDNWERLTTLTEYFRQNYFPWWEEIHSPGQRRIRLLNRTAWLDSNGNPVHIRVDRLGNLLYPDDPARHGFNTVDVLYDEMVNSCGIVAGANNLGSLYFSALARAAEAAVEKQQRGY